MTTVEFDLVRLSEICKTSSGGTPSRKDPKNYSGTIPWVKSGELNAGKIFGSEETISSNALATSAAKLLPAGTLLLAMYGATAGAVARLGIDAATNQAICAIEPGPRVSPEFLEQYLKSIKADLLNQRSGGAQPNLNQGQIKNLTIPLPPLPEQRRIAAILDKADHLRTQRRGALAHLDALTKSIFNDMFGRKNFLTSSLESVCSVIIDCPHTTPKWTKSGVTCLRTSNLGYGDWKWDDHRFVSEADHHLRSKRGYLEPGDIVLSREGTVGVLAIVPIGMVASMGQRLVQIRPGAAVATQYLLHLLLQDLAPETISHRMVGATSRHLNVRDLRALPIPIPPLELQQSFATRVAAVERLKARHRTQLTELDTLFASLQHRAFRGEL